MNDLKTTSKDEVIVDASNPNAVMGLGRRSIVDEKNPTVLMILQSRSKFPLLELRRVPPAYIYDEALFFIQYYNVHDYRSQRSGLETFGITFCINNDNLVIKPISGSHHNFDGKSFCIYQAEFLIENNKLVARAETGAWSEPHSIRARFEIAERDVVFKDQNTELKMVARKDAVFIFT
jgi:hypothetical protein